MGNTHASPLDVEKLTDELLLQVLQSLKTPMEVMKVLALSPALRHKISSPVIARGLLDRFFRTHECNMPPEECTSTP